MVENGSETEYIRFVAIARASENFRSDKSRRSAFTCKVLIIQSKDCKAEICNSDLILLFVLYRANEYVFHLNISVYNLLSLKEIQCKEDLLHYNEGLGLCELLTAGPLQDGHQSPLWLILQDYKNGLFVLIELQQSHHAGTIFKLPMHFNLVYQVLNSIPTRYYLLLLKLLDGDSLNLIVVVVITGLHKLLWLWAP